MKQLPEMPEESDLVIETPRLELRPIVQHDAQSMFHILSDPTLYEFTGDTQPDSIDALRKIYASGEARRSPDGMELWFNWVIRERSSGDITIGYMQASVVAAHADVAWVIGSKWQNRGYASEAAQGVVQWLHALGTPRIRAKIHPAHVASQRVAANAGLQRTQECSDGEEVWLREGV